jgi:hypothetical protein
MRKRLDAETQTRKRLLRRENLGLLLGVCLALAMAGIMGDRHIPQKWHAAGVGTILPFIFVIFSYPSQWLRRWSFWLSLVTCLVIHLVAIWIVFQYIFGNIQQLGILIWLPLAMLESFLLVFIVKVIENKLTGKRDIVELWG